MRRAFILSSVGIYLVASSCLFLGDADQIRTLTDRYANLSEDFIRFLGLAVLMFGILLVRFSHSVKKTSESKSPSTTPSDSSTKSSPKRGLTFRQAILLDFLAFGGLLAIMAFLVFFTAVDVSQYAIHFATLWIGFLLAAHGIDSVFNFFKALKV